MTAVCTLNATVPPVYEGLGGWFGTRSTDAHRKRSLSPHPQTLSRVRERGDASVAAFAQRHLNATVPPVYEGLGGWFGTRSTDAHRKRSLSPHPQTLSRVRERGDASVAAFAQRHLNATVPPVYEGLGGWFGTRSTDAHRKRSLSPHPQTLSRVRERGACKRRAVRYPPLPTRWERGTKGVGAIIQRRFRNDDRMTDISITVDDSASEIPELPSRRGGSPKEAGESNVSAACKPTCRRHSTESGAA